MNTKLSILISSVAEKILDSSNTAIDELEESLRSHPAITLLSVVPDGGNKKDKELYVKDLLWSMLVSGRLFYADQNGGYWRIRSDGSDITLERRQ